MALAFPAALYAEKLLLWYGRYARSLPWRIGPQAAAPISEQSEARQGARADERSETRRKINLAEPLSEGLAPRETRREQKKPLSGSAASARQGAETNRPDPYRVWLSEIMLQQTTTEAVKPYFAKFMQKWPNLPSLAAAPLEDILKAWAGLGYYSRARNLKACAARLMAEYNGRFPAAAAELQKLPGIGPYTSAAIAAIAFDESCAVVDANVERVIARLFYITAPLPAAKAEIKAACQAITPPNRAGDFAQAMMDLGATICTSRKPNCLLCPLAQLCPARQKGEAESLPRKAPKREREIRIGSAFVALSAQGRLYLQKRAASGLLGGMSEVPNYFAPIADERGGIGYSNKADERAQQARLGGSKKAADEQSEAFRKDKSPARVGVLAETAAETARAETAPPHAPFKARWHYQGRITHIFSHFELILAVYKAENIEETAARMDGREAGFWVKASAAPAEALPSVMKKALAKALPEIFKPQRR